MKKKSVVSLFFVVPLCLAAAVCAQDKQNDGDMEDCPMHKRLSAMDSHHAMVQKHGDEAMGFSHDTTTHHFLMATDGGSIEVGANDPKDKASVEAIRSHLSHIAVMFGNGDFSTPMFVHDDTPPGVTTMKILKGAIHYKYEEIATGGRVRIESSDVVALAAIHDFLRFQISEHQTGDSTSIVERK